LSVSYCENNKVPGNHQQSLIALMDGILIMLNIKRYPLMLFLFNHGKIQTEIGFRSIFSRHL